MAQILAAIRDPQAYLNGIAENVPLSRCLRNHIDATNILVAPRLQKAIEPLSARKSTLRQALESSLLTKRDYDRAWFVRLGYEACATDWRRIWSAMTAAELSYSAVVILDDIVDQGVMRLGHPCLHKTIGSEAAIYVAEMLSSLARIQLLRTFDDVSHTTAMVEEVLERNEKALRDLNYGQYLDVSASGGDPDGFNDQDYLNLIRHTTGVDVANCLTTGALLAKANKNQVTDLENIGEAIGVLMQLRDDLLDYASGPVDIDKTKGCDLAQFRMKLPYLIAYRFGNVTERSRLHSAGELHNGFDELRRVVLSTRTVTYVSELGRALYLRLMPLLENSDIRTETKEILASFAKDFLSFEQHA